uniref:Uncharacterized protein n=1 Tax=Meloidogyne enterolobii TaxID=390850 RepID=A0A6V7WVF4_MELEN|nr:unnamed protein product [Meloidogyne enterolobii]
MSFFSFLPIDLVEIFSYLIIFICGYKMVKYVNLNNNFDGNTKALNKLLTKVLIILAAKPFIEQAGVLFLIIYSETTNNITNIIRILIYNSFHLTAVFNPIICILTNTPYRNAILNRVQIHPH